MGQFAGFGVGLGGGGGGRSAGLLVLTRCTVKVTLALCWIARSPLSTSTARLCSPRSALLTCRRGALLSWPWGLPSSSKRSRWLLARRGSIATSTVKVPLLARSASSLGKPVSWRLQKSDEGLLLTVVAARPLHGEWAGAEDAGRWRVQVKLHE